MIVTIVADVLGEANNGTTIACINLSNALVNHGHTVRIVCPDKDKKGKNNYFIMPTYTFGPFQRIVDHNQVVLGKAEPLEMSRAIKDADVVHIMMPFMLGRAGVKIARRFNKPISFGFHCQAQNVSAHFFNFMEINWINHLIYKNFWNSCYQYADAIHYPTQFIRDLFEHEIHHKTPGYVISNGVNAIFRPKKVERPKDYEGKFVILMSGRYSKEKKQILLLKAVAHSKYKDKIKVVLAGGGPKEPTFRKFAKKHGIDLKLGFYNRDELVDVINTSDLYVHTSTVEIEAISCLEALSCGLVPVINNSPNSATKDFALDERCSFKMDDWKDLVGKIEYWIDHPEEKAELSEKYKDYAKRFDFDKWMEKMVEMITEVSKIKQASQNEK